MFTVHLKKENFKFSSTHFTIFGANHGERLHGHNYHVSCDLELNGLDRDLGMAIAFSDAKVKIKSVCEEWDERILLARNSPHQKLTEKDGQVQVEFAGKSYRFPADEVCILPVANVTVEELVRLTHQKLTAAFKGSAHLQGLAVTIEETAGQAVSYRA